MARRNYQRVLRSHAYSLATNNADDEEIRGALRTVERAELVNALSLVIMDLAPAQPAELSAAVGRVVGLIGGDWSRDNRDEFTTQAVRVFADMPGGLVLDALSRARRRVTAGRVLVAWVADDVDPKADRMRAEMDNLTRLANVLAPAT